MTHQRDTCPGCGKPKVADAERCRSCWAERGSEHGTYLRWADGCRCGACVAAWKARKVRQAEAMRVRRDHEYRARLAFVQALEPARKRRRR